MRKTLMSLTALVALVGFVSTANAAPVRFDVASVQSARVVPVQYWEHERWRGHDWRRHEERRRWHHWHHWHRW